MKSIIEIKQEMIKVPVPEKEWEKLFKDICKLLEEEGIDIESVNVCNFDFNDIMKEDFESKFIISFIKHALKINNSPLWENIISLKETKDTIQGHNDKVIKYTYNFIIEDKNDIIDSLSGKWVYLHRDLIDEFMDVNNSNFSILYKIRRELFPFSITRIV